MKRFVNGHAGIEEFSDEGVGFGVATIDQAVFPHPQTPESIERRSERLGFFPASRLRMARRISRRMSGWRDLSADTTWSEYFTPAGFWRRCIGPCPLSFAPNA